MTANCRVFAVIFRAFLMLIFALELAQSKRDFVLSYDSLECVNDEYDAIARYECQLEQRGNRSYINGILEFTRPIAKLEMRVILDMIRANMPRFNLVDTQMDGCDFLNSSPKQKFFVIILKYLRKFLNEMPTCPLKAHFNYTLTDFYFDEDDLPIYVPQSKFYTAVYIHDKGKKVAHWSVTGKIEAINQTGKNAHNPLKRK